ncbi:nucleotidyltransferase domain-containing protein (plasmid) [Rhizobium leguminosarum]|nr:nucleotidyltransferase domain-containing protein [Rhizobium leguminosarum]UIL31389.1 nucleotidyltransferase domain-containing protein [Rhizobium leguminosarum]
MDASGVASFILSSCPSLSEFEPYMFGSSLHGVGEDIDILVVGPSGEPLARLKRK